MSNDRPKIQGDQSQPPDGKKTGENRAKLEWEHKKFDS